ncbi:MAG: D-glycerate dehydrogenase [Chloroflexi bacterium]|nr:D-glycerate dehydrogenase [Chloroflexota bacterium]
MRVLQEVADVEVFPSLRRQISLEETIDGARRSDYLLGLHGNFVPAEVIKANPNLKGIAFLGGNTVKVDFDAALACKVPVLSAHPEDAAAAYSRGVGVATADLTVAMLLALAYRLLDADRYARADSTFQEQTMALMGVGCSGKTTGLIGLGRVGLHVARRLAAFDMRLLYTRRSRLTPEEEAKLGLQYVTLDELLRRSDYVSVQVSYNTTTHKMIGAREFALMKPSAYFINTARGRIVDEGALIEALQSGRIAGAGLEVFYNEPPTVWDPVVPQVLREMDNVILAPHNGGATYDSRSRQIMPLATGIKDLIEGRRPRGLLNPEVFGEPVLHPEFYDRGPIEPGDRGPDHFLVKG